MSKKSISICQGNGSLRHNNREFIAKNIDPSRTKDNIIFVNESLSLAYEKCFGDALKKYNKRQKRADRKITDYYNHLFHCDYSDSAVKTNEAKNSKKSFYELVIQIGSMEDSGINTPDKDIVSSCLIDYMNGFQKRNPNMYVFNAVLHLDEATPHLHIDYIPVGHCTRGLDTQNALGQALREMGYSNSYKSIAEWHSSERSILTQICNSKGIEISEPEKSRAVKFTVDEYKEYRSKIDSVKNELKSLEYEKEQLKAALGKQKQMLDEIAHETTNLQLKFKAQQLLDKCDFDDNKPKSAILNIGTIQTNKGKKFRNY